MIPHTVPNRPMNGVAPAVVARSPGSSRGRSPGPRCSCEAPDRARRRWPRRPPRPRAGSG
jgi:hypothetical protein